MRTTAKAGTLNRSVPSDPRNVTNIFSELGRHQLALAVESTMALCRGSEGLRKIQQEAAHEASVFHEETAQKLFGPCQVAELMETQVEIVRFTLQSAGKYWQQVTAHAMQTQIEMMSIATDVRENEKNAGVKSPLEVFQSAIPSLADSLFPMTAHVPEGQPLHS